MNLIRVETRDFIKNYLLLALSLLLMLMMFGCQNRSFDDPETASPSTEASSKTDTSSQLEEPFLSILNNQQSFYDVNREIYLSDYNCNIWEYAIVDLDSDDKNELAVRLDNSSILIFRKNADSIIGYNFGYQAMYQLNKDGTFHWNENAGKIYGCSTLQFSGNECKTVELRRVEHDESDSVTYYVNDKPVSEQEFQAVSTQHSTESVVWIPWTNTQ